MSGSENNKPLNAKPNLSTKALFIGAVDIVIVLLVMFVVSKSLQQPKLKFGSCTIHTEIARTADQKARGLAGRSTIDSNFGMVFPFQHEQPGFWMKDMLSSIDMVWLSGDKVVKVDASVPVDDGAITYYPNEPVDWVIEVRAGRASECGVMPNTIISGLWS